MLTLILLPCLDLLISCSFLPQTIQPTDQTIILNHEELLMLAWGKSLPLSDRNENSKQFYRTGKFLMIWLRLSMWIVILGKIWNYQSFFLNFLNFFEHFKFFLTLLMILTFLDFFSKSSFRFHRFFLPNKVSKTFYANLRSACFYFCG